MLFFGWSNSWSFFPLVLEFLPAFDHGHLLRSTLEGLENAPIGQRSDQNLSLDTLVHVPGSPLPGGLQLLELSLGKRRPGMCSNDRVITVTKCQARSDPLLAQHPQAEFQRHGDPSSVCQLARHLIKPLFRRIALPTCLLAELHDFVAMHLN